MVRVSLLVMLAGSLLAAPAASANVLLINISGGGDYLTIHEGIAAASDGDTLLVAPGTYPQADVDPGAKNLVITGQAGPDSTFIDVSQTGRGFHVHGGQDSTMVIQGFTISNGVGPYGGGIYAEGTSPTIRDCVFSGNWATGIGGALAASGGGHPTVIRSTFQSNASQNQGGAINVHTGGVALHSCSFFSNSSVQGGAVYFDACSATVDSCAFGSGNVATGAGGGGIRCSGGSLSLSNSTFIGCEAFAGGALAATFTDPCSVDSCDFVSNLASVQGGAVYAQNTPMSITGCGFADNNAGSSGGALYLYQSPASMASCTFLDNTALVAAGAVHVLYSTPTFSGCVFVGNSATDEGAVRVQQFATPVFENCLFHENSAANSVGALSIVDCDGSITGCTFTMNESPGVAAVYFGGSATTLTRSIIAFSPQGIAMQAIGGDPTTSHCCVYANAGGDSLEGSHHNNMFLDPLFCDMGDGDFTLCANSCCLPPNNIWFELIGAFPQGCAECLSVVRPTTWGQIKALYR